MKKMKRVNLKQQKMEMGTSKTEGNDHEFKGV
jgi:hypothetical protein